MGKASTVRKELWMCFYYIKAYPAQLGKQMPKQTILNKHPWEERLAGEVGI